jgi:hypothetical protein
MLWNISYKVQGKSMANFKRRRSVTTATKGATRVRGERQRKYKDGGSYSWYWLTRWPKWWDVVFHTRPKRRRQRQCIIAVLQGDDPDNIVWPLGNSKPHKYYW